MLLSAGMSGGLEVKVGKSFLRVSGRKVDSPLLFQLCCMDGRILIQNRAFTRLMLLRHYLPSLETRCPAKRGKLESATCILGPWSSYFLIASIRAQFLTVDLERLPRIFLEDWWQRK